MNCVVSSCLDCPFLNKHLDYEYGVSVNCNHPTIETIQIQKDDNEDPITPTDCPLKKENVTIAFDN